MERGDRENGKRGEREKMPTTLVAIALYKRTLSAAKAVPLILSARIIVSSRSRASNRRWCWES
jgi:hypothetical protein